MYNEQFPRGEDDEESKHSPPTKAPWMFTVGIIGLAVVVCGLAAFIVSLLLTSSTPSPDKGVSADISASSGESSPDKKLEKKDSDGGMTAEVNPEKKPEKDTEGTKSVPAEDVDSNVLTQEWYDANYQYVEPVRIAAQNWKTVRSASDTTDPYYYAAACETVRVGNGASGEVVVPDGQKNAWDTVYEEISNMTQACNELNTLATYDYNSLSPEQIKVIEDSIALADIAAQRIGDSLDSQGANAVPNGS